MRRWLRSFRKPAAWELDTELQFHLAELIREKMAEGLSADRARREARVEFGVAERIKEELRDVHRIPVLDAFSMHLRYAIRVLRRAPSFSLTIIATLTLGIGANTAVFSALDAVLLRPLPFPTPDRLVVLHQFRQREKTSESMVSPPRLEDWNRLNSTFQAISGYYIEDTTDTTSGYYAEAGDGGSLPVKIQRAFVAPRFLQVLGVSPAVGHDFTSEDEHFHGYSPDSVLISHRYWTQHFHSDAHAVGKPLLPGRSSAKVIGIMPAGFAFPSEDVELWYIVPPDAPYARNRRPTWYTGIGRMKPGISEAEAHANLAVVQAQLARQFPDTDMDLTVKLNNLKATTVGDAGASLWLLFGAVSVLLLIACANVSALVLARGLERQREFSLRFSLGASRFTVLAQVLTEMLVLAVCGTLAGLAVASVSARVLMSIAKSIPRIKGVGLDWRLFVYTAICALVVTMVAGLIPALQASGTPSGVALAAGGRTQVGGRRPSQWILVSVQVALAVCLLSGAGLLLRSFQALSMVSPGFDANHVLVFRVTGGYAETADLPKLRQSIRRTVDSLRALPGVRSAATSMTLPGVPLQRLIDLSSNDSGLDPAQRMTAESRNVSEGYFSTMGIPILAGTGCDAHSGDPGVVVNRSFVSAYFGERRVLGHHLSLSAPSSGLAPLIILGVSADAREAGLNQSPRPTMYWCGGAIDPDRYYLVGTAGDPASLAGAVRQAVHAVEPARAVYDLAPLASHLSDAFDEVRLRTLLLTLFAVTALSLACVGLYGTLSYFVTCRRREIGLRMALGADRRRVGLRFVVQGLAVTSAGVVAGLFLAAWSARFLSGMLYGVRPNDAAALTLPLVTMLSVALLASAVPAIRASRVDPMRILREE